MTLFDSESLYREKATIWRVFSLLPLYATLAGGHVWRWFAINIPMDFSTGGAFAGDIDILARLRSFPPSKEWIYKAWEVKVTLLCRDGTARSLKAGKISKTLSQLNNYKKFGSPNVSLLDIYVCESGFLINNVFPPPFLSQIIANKQAELKQGGYGYQLLPFEHYNVDGNDFGLLTIRSDQNLLRTTIDVLPPVVSKPRQPFSLLVDRLDDFFEKRRDLPRKPFSQIVFCKNCRRLQFISMREEYMCPGCSSNLIIQ